MESFKLPGFTLSVEAKPPRVEKALNNLFIECEKTQQTADVILKGNGIHIHQLSDYLPDWILNRLPHLEVGANPIMLYSPENQAAAIGKIENSLFCAWNSANGACINFICNLDKQRVSYGLFHPVLIPVLREIFLAHGRLLLHSAGVSCTNGTGALIIAISGGGKTTTTLSMVRLNANLIADDLIVLNPLPESAHAEGIPKALNLKNETIGFFQELKILPISSFTQKHRDKKSISASHVYGKKCMKLMADIHLIYFVKISSEGPTAKRLSVTDSLKRLALAHSFSRDQKLESRSINGLINALSKMDTYELTTGSNPELLGEWLIQHCSSHKK